jgi:hypothetical protein
MVDTNKNQKTVRRPLVTWRRRQAWITMLLGASILLCGMGIGFGSAMAYLGGSNTDVVTEEQLRPTKAAEAISKSLIAKCGLDEEQTVKVKEILLKRLNALRDIRTTAMKEMVLVHNEITKDLAGVMTPQQLEKWKRLSAEARKHSRFRHHPRRPGSQRGDRGDRGKHNGRGGEMSEMFKRLDKDNNGELTKDETEKASVKLQSFLKKADVNSDEKVDRKEFETQLRRHHRPPPDRDRKPRGRPEDDPPPERDRKPRGRPEDNPPPEPPAPDLSMIEPWN